MSISVFLYEFDIKNGPKLVKSIVDHEFSKEQLLLMSQNSFPESISSKKNENTLFFTFTIPNTSFFCFSLYITTINISHPRGHTQNTFIIVTDLPYYTPFYHFLLSSLSLTENSSPMTLYDILIISGDFLKKWVKQLISSEEKRIDLPMFVSSLPVAEPLKESDLFEDIPIYLINNAFLDIDVCSALEVCDLIKAGRTIDILRLWEISLFHENLIVFGANASFSSNAVLAISSFSYPIPNKNKIIPFISFTDSRLMPQNIKTLSSNSIIGISNPLIIEKLNESGNIFPNIFNIGFSKDLHHSSIEYENGLVNQRPKKWDYISRQENVTSKMIRKYLYENTIKVIKSIQKAFFNLCKTNPYEASCGNFDIDSLANILFLNEIDISNDNYEIFAQKLMKTKFIINICSHLCKDKAMENYLIQFPISQVCNTLNETDKIELYGKINQFKKKCGNSESIHQIIEKHLMAIKISISPNLAFSSS